MPNFRCRSVATVCKFSPGSPTIKRGGSRCSFFPGMNRAKTRRTWKPTESAQDCTSSSSRSRISTLLNDMRTSRPKRSTQPSSIVHSRWRRFPLPGNPGANLDQSIQKFISFCAPTAYFEIGMAQWIGCRLTPALLHCRRSIVANIVRAQRARDGGGAHLCNKLPFAFRRALPISALDSIVSGSHCASTILSESPASASHRAFHPRIVSEAADQFFKQARRRAFSFSCSIVEQISRSRGLGSSATIRLGILLALNRLSGNPLDQLKIFQLCAELEGHPDNAAPATFGGFTVVQSTLRQSSSCAGQAGRKPFLSALRGLATIVFRSLNPRP